MAASILQRCHVCGKETTKKCSCCSEGVDTQGNPSPTYYCSEACQRSDRSIHKKQCRFANARKQLFRGAELVQEVFYLFRQAAFDYDIKKIEIDKDEVLHVHPTPGEWDKWPMHPFPAHLISNVQQKKALLSWTACELAAACMNVLLKKILQDICTAGCATTEAMIRVNKSNSRIIRYNEDGSVRKDTTSHIIIIVTLLGGDSYVIDLAGAQYGQYQTVMTEQEYYRRCVEQHVTSFPFGYWKQHFSELLKAPRSTSVDGDYDHRTVKVGLEASNALKDAVDEWEESSSCTVRDSLTAKSEKYRLDKNQLLEQVDEMVRGFMCWAKAHPDKMWRIVQEPLSKEVDSINSDAEEGAFQTQSEDADAKANDTSSSDRYQAPWESYVPFGADGAPIPPDVIDFLESQKGSGNYHLDLRDGGFNVRKM